MGYAPLCYANTSYFPSFAPLRSLRVFRAATLRETKDTFVAKELILEIPYLRE